MMIKLSNHPLPPESGWPNNWVNCETPDCEFKVCYWASDRLCFKCCEAIVGLAAMIAQFNRTHDISWYEAAALDANELQHCWWWEFEPPYVAPCGSCAACTSRGSTK